MAAARRLIVTADDYGLTEGVSRGILEGHNNGIITSTSVLVLGSAFEATVSWLRDVPELATGAHLALVGEDPPLCEPGSIPSLVDRNGRLPGSWRAFLARAALGRVRAEDVHRELAAQLQRLRTAGVQISHLDTHQHLHLWPPVREVVLQLVREFRVPCVRVPRSHGGRLAGLGVNVLARALARRVREERVQAPGDFAGFDEAGDMAGVKLETALDRLAHGGASVCELSAHPGTADDPSRGRYAWGYRWSEELRALTAAETSKALRRHGFELCSYATLAEGPLS